MHLMMSEFGIKDRLASSLKNIRVLASWDQTLIRTTFFRYKDKNDSPTQTNAKAAQKSPLFILVVVGTDKVKPGH